MAMFVQRNDLTRFVCYVLTFISLMFLPAATYAWSMEEYFEKEVEETVSLSVSNMYLYRGQDMGEGTGLASIAGGYKASTKGFYLGLDAISGHVNQGTLVNIYSGYAFKLWGMDLDAYLRTYYYPSDKSCNSEIEDCTSDLKDFSELGIMTRYKYFTLSIDNNVVGEKGNVYYLGSFKKGPYELSVGYHYFEPIVNVEINYTHIDLSFYRSNYFKLTYSQIVDSSGPTQNTDEDPKLVLSYKFYLD